METTRNTSTSNAPISFEQQAHLLSVAFTALRNVVGGRSVPQGRTQIVEEFRNVPQDQIIDQVVQDTAEAAAVLTYADEYLQGRLDAVVANQQPPQRYTQIRDSWIAK